ncbi:lipocalin-like [Pelodiscus sinensis]|uniref:Prostaglandin-H2 D-isomerase n=1 Tax=Pelodiscus sinensis TaxID=13735 RepID=K7FDF7_PELSI|nr:lipocalin-like [Pelodiscus sinensis]|eukprot:XP_006134824.1 lipocalin-like [Pelodiscus sinensis]
MQAVLLSLLGLALLRALHGQEEVPVQPDFQLEKFTGKWYSIGLASSSRWFKEKKQVLRMCTTVIMPSADGNLDITSTYPKLDKCEKRNSLFIKTDQPGRFSYTSPRSGSQHDIRVVETNYNEYALLHTKMLKGTDSFTMVTLYGRTKELNPELLEKFSQFSMVQGLPEDAILLLPKTDKCMTDAA